MNNKVYAGDLTPKDAWTLLAENKDAVLLDCRTTAEWQFVGVPNLESIGKETMHLDWQIYPQMQVRGDFVATVEGTGIQKDSPILVLCRSGVRSIAAAIALSDAGYTQAYNILDGFEGQFDDEHHRGAGGSGWKASGLPWRQ